MELTYTFHKEFTFTLSKEELREKYNLYRKFYPHLSDIEILKNVYVNYRILNAEHHIDSFIIDLDLTKDQFAKLAKEELGL